MTSSNNSDQPTIGSKGQQVWNPSVGIYADINRQERESYGGIITALQDQQSYTGRTIRSYPENFAGIIAAIHDLAKYTYTPGSDVGDKPPGGNIGIDEITGEPIYIENGVVDGQLWFDTRQGRLLVSIDGNWYQTNGGDGIPYVTNNAITPPTGAVPGQLWWVRESNELYIFDGYYILGDDSLTEDPEAGGDPVWKLVNGGDGATLGTTATLPLIAVGQDVLNLPEQEHLPAATGIMAVQRDYNLWVLQCLLSLNAGLTPLQPLLVADAAPADGQLWYDSSSSELKAHVNGVWQPAIDISDLETGLGGVVSQLDSETNDRTAAIQQLQGQITQLDQELSLDLAVLQTRYNNLLAQVNAIPTVNLDPYITQAQLLAVEEALSERLQDLETAAPDLSLLMSRQEIEAELQSLETAQADLASHADLHEVEASIPDVSSFVRQSDIDDSIAAITVEYLPRTGGVLTGSFVVEKEDYALPGFDFSSAPWHSKNAFKLISNGSGATPASFGTTEADWEIGWTFEGHEDFCWNHSENGKQLSVSKDGVACKQLMIADFAANNEQGRVTVNEIDVKDRLQRYQSAFEQLRAGLHASNDFESLKAAMISALANV